MPGVSTHCPITCGGACGDSEARFKLVKSDGTAINRYCSWVGNKQTEARCALEGVSDTCRSTCSGTTGVPRANGDICSSNSDCASGFCASDTGICYATSLCKAAKHSAGETFHENKVVYVFVGSDFSDLTSYRTQVSNSMSRFDDFPFFGPDADYVALYVDQLEPTYCECGCFDIDRLLCCEEDKAKSLAEKCLDPNLATTQVIAIHNDDTYCNSGGEVVSISTNFWGPLVIAHEVAHALFSLVDEYDWGWERETSFPNCDPTPGCPYWADLIPYYPDLCTYKGCGDGDYYIVRKTAS